MCTLPIGYAQRNLICSALYRMLCISTLSFKLFHASLLNVLPMPHSQEGREVRGNGPDFVLEPDLINSKRNALKLNNKLQLDGGRSRDD